MTLISQEQILSSTRRLPFLQSDLDVAFHFIQRNNANSLDTQVAGDQSEIFERLKSGSLLLRSRSMNTDVLYVKIDGGKGFFGGQKSLFASYVGDCDSDQFEAGPVFKSWIQALTSMNNLYRAAGLLSGAAL